MYDLVIVGAGPAGLTACLYALRSRLSVLLVDKAQPGGYLSQIHNLENYPGFPNGISGSELADNMCKQLQHYAYRYNQLEVKGIKKNNDDNWELSTDSKPILAKSIIISTGSIPAKLGIEGEEEFTGRGVSYCGVCDAPFFKNKDVVVIGGGNTALEEAIYLPKFASSVRIIHRRQQLRADKVLQEKARENKKISFILSSICTKISGQQTVQEVTIKDSQGKLQQIRIQGVFIFVGMKPQTAFLTDLVKKDTSGYILTDKDLQSSEKGIFACGDCRDISLRQVITACGEGAIAAQSVRKCLE